VKTVQAYTQSFYRYHLINLAIIFQGIIAFPCLTYWSLRHYYPFRTVDRI